MRTTLTIDDDVALLLDRTREIQGRRFEEIVNDALRSTQPSAKPHTTPSVSVGRCFIDNVDDVAAVLAFGEGEDFK
ncbi:MAG: DUF2191 domain-containing protein [Acidobacteriota bacterium]